MKKSTVKEAAKPSTDMVEDTTLSLIQEGYTISEISKLLGFNISPVIAELIFKGILYPGATFRNVPVKPKYQLICDKKES